MNRRNFIKIASAFPLAVTLPNTAGHPQTDAGVPVSGSPVPDSAPAPAAEAPAASEAAFSEDWLLRRAEELAQQPFSQPELTLPAELADLNQARYRAIQFKPEAAVWKDDQVNFNLQFFHTGFQYKNPVEIFLIEDEVPRLYPYSPALFNFGEPLTPPPADSQSGFSGVRVHSPIHQPNGKDPVLVFLGASFFRAIATGQAFGTLARGISINTAQAEGEEFPFFRTLWIRKPAPGDRQLTVYGLLDGPSLTGSYKIRVEPGRFTIMDVECSLFPRRQLDHVGIGSLNSMYFFGAADATRVDDYRPNVHSCDGLQIWNASGEWIWRPLTNPEHLQYSVFQDRTPKGFGLLQRKRAFSDFEDIDSRFGDRPSLWVEPQGDWGDGAVDLIEVPSRGEIYDNIIAFWRPKSPLMEKARYSFRYRLHWGWEPPVRSSRAFAMQTRIGGRGSSGQRFFVIDFVSGHSCNGCDLPDFAADVRSGDGEIKNVVVRNNPATGGQRVTFDFQPGSEQQTDIRCELKQNGQVISETWVYRWTS
jgi:glucans biosynthesis protein